MDNPDIEYTEKLENENIFLKQEILKLKSELEKHNSVKNNKEEQFYLRQIITDNITPAIFVTDINGYCTFLNPSAKEMFGFTFEEIKQKPLHYMIHHTHTDGTPFSMEKCAVHNVNQQDLKDYQDIFIRKDGSFFYVKISTHIIYENNNPTFTIIEIRDITQEKISEKLLKSSEERFRFLSESIPQLIWTTDSIGNVDYFNNRWNQYPGIELKKNWYEIVHPDDIPEVIHLWEKSVNNSTEFNSEFRLQGSDGLYTWFTGRAIPLKNEQGKVIKWFCSADDINEHKKNIENQKFLVEASTQLISSIDFELTLRNISKMAVPFFADWCRVDLYDGKRIKLLSVAHKDPDKEYLAIELDSKYTSDINTYSGAANVIRTGKPEFVHKLTDEILNQSIQNKEYLNIVQQLGLKSLIIIPIKRQNVTIGAITFVTAESGRLYSENDLSIAEDLGRRASLAIDNSILYNELQEESRINETLYQLSSSISELELNKLVQKITDECTLLVNAQFGSFFYNLIDEKGESYMLYTISGVPREKFSNFPMPRNTDVFAPTFNGEGVVRLDDVTKDPRYGKNEPYYGMPEGHLPVRSYLAVPVISLTGEVIGGLFFGHESIGVFKERDERIVAGIAYQAAAAIDNARLYKKSQDTAIELEKQKNDLIRSNDELKQFAYVASHDLQEPLRSISGYTQLLERRYKNKLGDEANDYINFIISGAKRMKDLINDLLDYSRFGTDNKFSDVDINHVIQNVIFDLKLFIDERQAQITYSDMPIIKGNENSIIRLFQNLISNAIKYCDQPIPLIDISVEKKDNYWLFSVKDNGIGIDKIYYDKIFALFQRLHGVKDKYGGTGIGLATCKKIVEIHNGKIWLDSEPNQGSTFFFTLPV